jgi:carboxylesterase type B
MLDRLDVRPANLEALQALPVADILAAQPDISDEPNAGIAGLPWQPVLDDEVLHELPVDAIAAGHAAGVHLMTGSNQHEMTLFQILDATLAELDDAGIIDRLSLVLRDPAGLLRTYREVMPDASIPELWLAISTDGVFRIPAIRLLEAQAAHAPVWLYRFAYETPVFGGLLRSTHALEIPFVFDTLEQRGADKLTGTGPERSAIADAMHRAWIAFAQNGDPGWPAYEAPRLATMRFGRPGADAVAELVDDPDGILRRAWDAASA